MPFTVQTNRASGYKVEEADWDALTDNTTFLNTAFHIPLFPLSPGIAPSSGLQGAGYALKQSTDAATIKPEWPELSFDPTTAEGRIWNGRVPRGYGSTPTLVGAFYTGATSGNLVLASQMACMSDTDTSVVSKPYAAENTITIATPASANKLAYFSMSMAIADSIAAGDWFSLMFRRNASSGSDTVNSNDMLLLLLDLYFALA